MHRPLKIYTASKLHYADLFKHLRTQWPEFHFTARWPFFRGQVSDSPEEASKFWIDDFDDVKRADVVLCYSAGQDQLKGALVEVGMALALCKPVIVIGLDHTWTYHPLVQRAKDWDDVHRILLDIAAAL